MHVQDFTVIRISPIVYNDRDILEIGVILHGPKLGIQTHTHCLQQQHVMHGLANTPTQCSNTQNKESLLVLATVCSTCAKLKVTAFPRNNKNRLHRFAVFIFTGLDLCLINFELLGLF